MGLVGPPSSTNFGVGALLDLLRPFLQEMAAEAVRVALAHTEVPTLIPASVVAHDITSGISTVLPDGPAGGANIPARSLVGRLTIGTRVMLMFQPPSGVFVVGIIGNNPAFSLDGWTSFTPTITSTAVNPTMLAAHRGGGYWRFGKTCIARMEFNWVTIGTTENIGTGFYLFSLPFAAANMTQQGTLGAASYIRSGVRQYVGCSRLNDANHVVLDVEGATSCGAANPVVPGNGDPYVFDLIYQTA